MSAADGKKFIFSVVPIYGMCQVIETAIRR